MRYLQIYWVQVVSNLLNEYKCLKKNHFPIVDIVNYWSVSINIGD